ncbi:MAG: polymer-forming cytoskeletal protein [Anaerolineae bacterium]|nr:polymer-forming cytoskeletal protein [Anaerolineae bacterium]
MSLFRRQPPTDPTPAPAPTPAERPVPPQPAPPPVREPSIPPAAQPVGFETVLGANSTFEGTFSSHANVRIDGTFTGHIDIDGNALVGETAKISADLTAKNISIAGAVRGNVTGKKVQILRTGRVWGDITATALSTEEGAFIDGKISMVSKESTTSTQEMTTAPVVETAPVIEAPTEPDFLAGNETTVSDDTTAFAEDDADELR